ncbi:MAG: J domain-containing protein [Desulfobacteraceae bacterium]|nr:J domain-containing protein [Desulfobacteraceae bacterium]
MLVDYLRLGVALDATDAQIRKAYLALIRVHTPERDPARFQEIAAAYERIKDEAARLQTAIFGPFQISDTREAIGALARAATPGRRRVGLGTLLEAVGLGLCQHSSTGAVTSPKTGKKG